MKSNLIKKKNNKFLYIAPLVFYTLSPIIAYVIANFITMLFNFNDKETFLLIVTYFSIIAVAVGFILLIRNVLVKDLPIDIFYNLFQISSNTYVIFRFEYVNDGTSLIDNELMGNLSLIELNRIKIESDFIGFPTYHEDTFGNSIVCYISYYTKILPFFPIVTDGIFFSMKQSEKI